LVCALDKHQLRVLVIGAKHLPVRDVYCKVEFSGIAEVHAPCMLNDASRFNALFLAAVLALWRVLR
jgi:hypothetical protein